MYKGGDYVPKQLKHSVNYRQDKVEIELYEWVEKKRGLIKAADFIKTILLEAKIKDEEKK